MFVLHAPLLAPPTRKAAPLTPVVPTPATRCYALQQQDNLELQLNKSKMVIDQTDVKFPESNLMHQMNGFIACNGPTLQLPVGSRVRWLVLGFGSEVDMHSPVFDGQAIEYAGAHAHSWRLRGGDLAPLFVHDDCLTHRLRDGHHHTLVSDSPLLLLLLLLPPRPRHRRRARLLCWPDALQHVCCGDGCQQCGHVPVLLQHPGPHHGRHEGTHGGQLSVTAALWVGHLPFTHTCARVVCSFQLALICV